MISKFDFLGGCGAEGAPFWYPGGISDAGFGGYRALLFLYEKFG